MAIALFREVMDQPLQTNVIAYNVAISACEKGQRWEHALDIIGACQRSCLQLALGTYSAAVGACEKAWQWQHALALVDDVRCAYMEPDLIMYHAMVGACSRCLGWQRALAVLSRMTKGPQQINLDDLILSMVGTMVERAGQLKWSACLLHSILRKVIAMCLRPLEQNHPCVYSVSCLEALGALNSIAERSFFRKAVSPAFRWICWLADPSRMQTSRLTPDFADFGVSNTRAVLTYLRLDRSVLSSTCAH